MKKFMIALITAGFMLVGVQAGAKEWKEVKIGVEGAYPPFSLVDKDGKLQGFDIDITYALCDAMKVKCTLVKQDFDGLIPSLLAKKIDAIIASMSITEERKQKVDFTHKYYNSPAKFVRKKGSGMEITKAGLKGKTVGVQQSTVHDTYLTDNYGDVVSIKRYGTLDDAYLDLAAGRLDLLLADSVAVKEGLLDKPAGKDFEFVGPDLTDPKWFGEGIGIAVRKQDTELREKFNKAIDAIRANGTYKKIQDKYFNFDIYGG
jgi:arginine/ornithine transport system substrate-binding protein